MTEENPTAEWRTRQLEDEDTEYYTCTIADCFDLVVFPVETVPPNEDTWFLQIMTADGDDILPGTHYRGTLDDARQVTVNHFAALLLQWAGQLPGSAIGASLLETTECRSCRDTWHKPALGRCNYCQQLTCYYCLTPDEEGETEICRPCLEKI